MARKGRKRTRGGKPNTWLSKGRNALSIASQALTMAMAIKRLMNVEHKFTQVSVSESVASAGTIHFLTGIAQGVTQNQRTGNKVKANDIYVRGYLRINGTNNAFVRIVLVNDKSSQGTVPVITDILEAATVNSPLNIENCPSRFKILYDKVQNVESSLKQQQFVKIYRRLNYHSTFGGTDATQASAENGHLYIFALTNVGSTFPSWDFSTKYNYIDN